MRGAIDRLTMRNGDPAENVNVAPKLLPHSALLVIDMQNGFCHPDGSAASAGHEIAPQRSVLPRVRALVRAAHESGLPVFWSRQEHLADDVTRRDHALPTHIEKGHYLPCVRGTWDAEIISELSDLITDDDVVFVKHRASCFFNTVLELELRMRDIGMILVTGVATNYCVDATIRDAYAHDLDLFVIEDGCACSYPDLHEATMKNVELFHGRVVKTDEIVLALERAEGPREND